MVVVAHAAMLSGNPKRHRGSIQYIDDQQMWKKAVDYSTWKLSDMHLHIQAHLGDSASMPPAIGDAAPENFWGDARGDAICKSKVSRSAFASFLSAGFWGQNVAMGQIIWWQKPISLAERCDGRRVVMVVWWWSVLGLDLVVLLEACCLVCV